MTFVLSFVRMTMESQVGLGIMGFLLIAVPILGIWAIHEFGWTH